MQILNIARYDAKWLKIIGPESMNQYKINHIKLSAQVFQKRVKIKMKQKETSPVRD